MDNILCKYCDCPRFEHDDDKCPDSINFDTGVMKPRATTFAPMKCAVCKEVLSDDEPRIMRFDDESPDGPIENDTHYHCTTEVADAL